MEMHSFYMSEKEFVKFLKLFSDLPGIVYRKTKLKHNTLGGFIMRKKNLKKIIGIIIIGLIIAASLLIISYTRRSNNNLPRLKEVTQMSYDSFEQLKELVKTLEEKDLIKAWGKPQILYDRRVWTVNHSGDTKYVIAYVEEDKVTLLDKTETIYITVVKDDNGTIYWLCDTSNYTTFTTNVGYLTSPISKDVFGNEMTCEAGAKIKVEVEEIGGVLESYPQSLMVLVYGYKTVGHLSDSEVSAIASDISKCLHLP